MTALVGYPAAFELSTDDWRLYPQRFAHFLLASFLLAHLVAPQKPGELSYNQICKQLEKHFSPKLVKIAERFRFHNHQQQSGETVTDYLADLRKLAIYCEFGEFLEDALCDRLVCGLKDEAMQQKLLGEADLSLKKAFEITQAMEAAAKNAREIQTTGQQKPCEVNAIIASRFSTKQPTTKNNMKCIRCLGTGHDAFMCKFRSAKCNNCKRIGHIAKACRSEKREKKTKGSPLQPRRTQKLKWNAPGYTH